jgi:hypothetical protein
MSTVLITHLCDTRVGAKTQGPANAVFEQVITTPQNHLHRLTRQNSPRKTPDTHRASDHGLLRPAKGCQGSLTRCQLAAIKETLPSADTCGHVFCLPLLCLCSQEMKEKMWRKKEKESVSPVRLVRISWEAVAPVGNQVARRERPRMILFPSPPALPLV